MADIIINHLKIKNLHKILNKPFARTVREHWSVEIMHWHLDVTFKEDANTTLDKTAAKNLNIINKWCLSILKLFEAGKKMSLRKKRYYISMNAKEHLE